MDIKNVIKKHGFTVTAVAEKMGVTQTTLSRTLSGNPTIQTLQRIADVIGCRVGDFFADEIQAQETNENSIKCPLCGSVFELKGE